MKRILKHLNWRNDTLFALFALTLVLLLSEGETWTALFISKLAGIASAYAFYRLFTYWEAQGKIKDLTSLAGEE